MANYYAQVHPGVQLLGLDGVTTAEEITADEYLSVIRPQILSALDSSVSTIVTTKGLPLRINVTESRPASYTDPFGVTRTTNVSWWKPYSSLESELTRIDVISTWQQMGDQKYYSWTGLPDAPHPACNPYYNVTADFNYDDYYKGADYGGMRLTARLDGFTVTDVKNAINRAQKAYIVPTSGSQSFVLDDDPNSVGGDQLVQLRDNVLIPSGTDYVYDNTDTAVTTVSGSVLGYVSHGVNDGSGGLETGYITDQLDLSLANGAVFQTHESYNAYSFQPDGNLGGQGLVAEWLAIGGAAGVGHVQEPYSGTTYEANEDQLFNMLLNGYTWAEAAWSSMRQLSYVNTVVGDPLMTWKPAMVGDADLNGTVNGNDVNAVLSNYNASGAYWQNGDFNGDGSVNGTDLNIVLACFNQSSQASNSAAVPEPGTLAMLLLALLAVCQRRRIAFSR